MLAAQGIPLYVPLVFLAFGMLMTAGHRRAFRDPEGYLRNMARILANSRGVRVLGGSGDPEVEFRGLW